MRNTKAGVWIRIALGVAVIVGGPAILIAVMRSAYQTSPVPGGIDRATFDYPRPGDSAQAVGATPAAVKPPAAPIPAPAIAPAPPPSPPAAESEPGTPAQPGDPCADTQQEIAQIKSRMSQAYTPAEGKYFRERLQKLNQQANALKCGP